jgi:ribosome-associated translation inhibitor RaiA
MKFEINDKQKLLSQTARDRAMSRAFATVQKFADYVKGVTITVQDINGPKGGVDKECQVIVSLRGKNDIVVSAKDEKLSKAIPGALDRASRTAKKLVNRQWRKPRSPNRRLRASLSPQI